jgi:hypothetical protein
MHQGRLQILVAVGVDERDQETYRFGHLSYQEYLTGRAYHQALTKSYFDSQRVVELFGNPPWRAFTSVKQHLVLQLLQGIFKEEQFLLFAAVMFGGRIDRACTRVPRDRFQP